MGDEHEHKHKHEHEEGCACGCGHPRENGEAREHEHCGDGEHGHAHERCCGEHEHHHEHEHGEACGCGHDHAHEHGHGHTHDCGHEHHHAHGHDDGCCCASCHAAERIFQETEEDERRAGAEFRREITFLAVTGAIFFAAFAVEELHLFHDESTHTLLHAVFAVLYVITGWPVLRTAFRALLRGDFFNEFTLMGGATLAAFAIGETCETVGVMLFYRLGEAFQERAASNSRRSIKALLAEKPVTARLVKDGETIEKDPQEIKKGDVVQVLPGEIIPIDGVIVGGESQLDCSAITGESMPVPVKPGAQVHGGALSLDGLLLVEAAGPFEDSTIARMLEMVQNAVERKAPTERFITKFAKWYTPAVFFAAAAVMLASRFAGGADWHESIYRGLVLLVISCPCALVISIPLGYFGGIGAASKHGILVKGANVFDALGKVESAVFDKTGTLTYGRFRVSNVTPAEGVTREELLSTAALAESGSPHPVARAIAEAAGAKLAPEGASITQLPGRGMVCKINGDTIISGNAALLEEYGVTPPPVDEHGTVAYVMKNGRYLGVITAADAVRPESAEAVKELRALGIKGVYMLTGDREETAARVAKELSLDGWRAELLPGDKVNALREICGGDTKKTASAGAGVKCAPALETPETGLGVGGSGSRVAVEAADAVILDDSPAKVADLLRIAKKTRAIVWQNVALALGVKGVFLVLGASGHAGLWEAVFADVGVALMAILNATRATRLK